MDDQHAAELDRIMENRKKRGVNVNFGPAVSLPPPSLSSIGQPVFNLPPQDTSQRHVVSPSPAAQQPPADEQPNEGATPPIAKGLQSTPGFVSGRPIRLSNTGDSVTLDSLLAKGTFENFRRAPLHVTPNVKGYAKSQKSNEPTKPTSPAFPLVTTSTNNYGITLPNPFRTQTFDEFLQAPDDRSVPPVVEKILHCRNAPQSGRIALSNSRSSIERPSDNPVYSPNTSISRLCEGDWFLKWTRADKVHQRFVWLSLEENAIHWARAPDSSMFFISSIKFVEVSSIEASCLQNEAGRTCYQLIVRAVSRSLCLGTEIREKFDLWYETLRRMSEQNRAYASQFYNRVSTTPSARGKNYQENSAVAPSD